MRITLLSFLSVGLETSFANPNQFFSNPKTSVYNVFRTVAILVGLLASTTALMAQTSYSTVQNGDWEDNATWANGDAPSLKIDHGDEVLILHNVNVGDDEKVTVKNGFLKILDSGKLFLEEEKLKVDREGVFIIENGFLYVGEGEIENRGRMDLINAYVEIEDGKFKNKEYLYFENSCVRVLEGEFRNDGQGSIDGPDGNVQTEDGKIHNHANWSSNIDYCSSQTAHGSFPMSPNCDVVVENCDCLEEPCEPENPDIIPGYTGEGEIVSPGLASLAIDEVHEFLLDELFIFSPDGGSVLIDVNFIDNQAGYTGALDILDNYVSLDGIIYNGFTSNNAQSNFVTLFFPIVDLIDLDTTVAHAEFINFVQQTSPSRTNDFTPVTGSSLPNQGDFAQETYLTRLGYDLTGAGAKVGILSDSYDQGGSGDPGNDVTSGYLPGAGNDSFPQPVVVVKDLPSNFGQGIDEGRAMAQIVHSVAPAAEMYFHTAFEGPGPMAEAIVDLYETYNCNIITDDITQPTQPFFGEGLVSRAINDVTAGGVEYYTSAGNFGSRAFLTSYNDLNGAHDFGGGDTLQNIDLGTGEFLLIMQWDDRFYSIDGAPGAADDFDIFLADDDGNNIYNFNKRNAGGDPVEIMPFYVTSPTTTNIKIRRMSGSGSPRIKYIVYKAGDGNDGFNPVDGSSGWGAGTITGHAASPNAFTLGAVRWDKTGTYGGTLETQGFSSHGDFGMGKPDATAVNGGNISFDLGGGDWAGDADVLPNFFGTSSSAPHIAGLAAIMLEAQSKFNLTFNTQVEMLDNAIDYGEPTNVQGAGFISAYDVLTEFANPTPEITMVDLEGLGVDPTTGGVIVIIGQYFVDSTQVFFRGEEIFPIETTDSTITVIIPPFGGGDPQIVVVNNAMASGDGGSDTTDIFDIPLVQIDIVAADTTRKYGTANPEFSFTTTPALSPVEMSLLTPFVEYNTSAQAFSNAGTFTPINVSLNSPINELPVQLSELYEFNFVPGNLGIDPIELRIQPTNFSATYGAPILDSIQYYYFFGDSNTVIDPAVEAQMKDEVNTQYLGIQHSSGVNYLGLTNISLSNFLSLSNFISLSNISLSNISLSNISLSNISLSNAGIAFVASDNTIQNISLSNISLSNISLSNISLSNISLSNVLPVDAQLFWDESTSSSVDLGGANRPSWNGGNNPNFSIGNISLSNFISLSNGAAGLNAVPAIEPELNISLSNISLSNISLSNISLSNISLSNISLSNISLSNISLSNGTIAEDYNLPFRNFISLSNNDNTDIVGMLSPADTNDLGITMVPVNLITGLGAGNQFIIPAAFFSNTLSQNYIVSYGVGLAVIEKSELTLAIDNIAMTYGDTVPQITATLSGLKYADQISNIIEGFDIIDFDSTAGTYVIEPIFVEPLNYNVATTNGQLTVNARPVTVAIANDTIVYGDTEPSYTAVVSNLAFGDVPADIYNSLSALDYTGDAGTYAIDATLATNLNYLPTVLQGELLVNRAILNVTPNDTSKVYGELNPNFTLSYSGFVYGEDAGVLNSVPLVSSIADQLSPVGSYPIVASGGSDSNYVYSFSEGALSVGKKFIDVTAINSARLYGEANPTFAVTYSGFVNGENEGVLNVVPTANSAADQFSPVGSYNITAAGGIDDNYAFSYTAGTLTIGRAILSARPVDTSKVYGEANPAFAMTYSGFVNGEDSGVLDTIPHTMSLANETSWVGTYEITANGGSDSNYTFSYTPGILAVTKKDLTATPVNNSRVYGEINPIFDVAYTGFVNGDSENDIDTEPLPSSLADEMSNVDDYPVTLTGGLDNNYSFSLAQGTLSVTKRTLVATADDASRIYGVPNPPLTVSYSGFANSENASVIDAEPTAATLADMNSPVGNYPITVSGGLDNNYAFTFEDGTLTIGQLMLTVTADNISKVYGEGNPTLTLSYSGFVNGDDVSNLDSAPGASTLADATSDVDTYEIIVAGGSDANYTFVYVPGVLTVTKKELTATPVSTSRIYGSANPIFDVAYTGFVNGDNDSDINTEPVGASVADELSDVDDYPIVLAGGLDNNYSFALAQGTLSVTKRTLVATANDTSRIYGVPNPPLSVSYSGFANSENASVIDTEPTAATLADINSPVGNYPITVSGGLDNNYAFTFEEGTLTIGQLMLTVTADSKSKVYGEANPTLTLSYSGFVNGDNESNLGSAPGASTLADATSDVDTYEIIVAGGSDANYTFVYVPGVLTVTKKELTATPVSTSRIYGSANPIFDVAYTGFVNGDNDGNIDSEPVVSSPADELSDVDDYPIVLTGGLDDNYSFAFAQGTLSVTKRTLVATANDTSRIYGVPNPPLSVFYSGFANSENASVIDTEPTAATLADINSPVGNYPITVSGGLDNNYAFTFEEGTLTIGQLMLTVTADSKSKVYGEANPTLTLSYSGFVNGDNESNLGSAPGASTLADATSDVDTYEIIVAGGSDANYTFVYVPGVLTVTKKDLIATSLSNSREYGESDPAFMFSYAGFVNGDDVADITEPTGTTFTTCNSPVGTYDINVVGGSGTNYAIVGSPSPGQMTITPAVLSVIADDFVVPYEDPEPVYTYTISGLKCGETFNDVFMNASAITLELDQPFGNPGYYEIIVSVHETPLNYTVDITNGELLILNAPGGEPLTFSQKLCITYEENHPSGFDYEAVFLYRNVNDFPIFVENGPDNEFIGPGVSESGPIELFDNGGLLGFQIFKIRFDGGDLQWVISSFGVTDTSNIINASSGLCFGSMSEAPGNDNDPLQGFDVLDLMEVRSEDSPINEARIQVYPNPFSDVLTFEIEQNLSSSSIVRSSLDDLKIAVTNTMGQKVDFRRIEMLPNDKIEVDLSELVSGVYFVRLSNDNIDRIFKVIKR